MRQVVGALRDPAEGPALAPQPSLSLVDKLVAQACDAGLAALLDIEGGPVISCLPWRGSSVRRLARRRR
jgi:hypothetical protein